MNLFFFLFFPFIVFAQEDALLLPALIVQGRPEPLSTPLPLPSKKIRELEQKKTPAQKGAPVRNEWGVRTTSLFSERDMAQERPVSSTLTGEQEWAGKLTLGEVRGVALDLHKLQGKLEYALKVGQGEDHQHLYFLDSGPSQWEESDDFKNFITPDKKHSFAQAHASYEKFIGKVAWDQSTENIFILQRQVGRNSLQKKEADLFWREGRNQLGLYGFWHEQDFVANSWNGPSVPKNNQTRSLHYGARAKNEQRDFSLAIDGSEYKGQRQGALMTTQSFTRRLMEMDFLFKKNGRRWNAGLNLQAQKLTDQLRSPQLLVKESWPWRAEFLPQFNFFPFLGWQMKSVVERKAPTVTMVFGDGKGNLPAADLPLEKKFFVSTGPRLELKEKKWTGLLTVEAFFEQNKRTPYWQSSSPVSGRYFPLGGTWSRGAEALLNLTHPWGKMEVSYKKQQALSQSTLSWERGKELPLTPREQWKWQQEWRYRALALALDGRYQSKSYQDLANLFLLPRFVHVDLKLSVAQKFWGASLAAKNIWARPRLESFGNSSSIISTRAPELLDMSPHFSFTLEFYL